MAKPKGSSKPNKTSIFLCCFGSSSSMESRPPTKGYDLDLISKIKNKNKKKKTSTTSSTSWFSWRRIRFNKNSPYKTVPLDHPHYSKSKSNSKSKSTLHHKPQAPATNPPPPPQPAPVLPATPYYTPTQTRHGAHSVEDTRQQGRASPAHAKRQARRLPMSSMQTRTTHKKAQNGVVGMSVLVVTLVIMIFWGRLCAILCTSAWLYITPRFRKSGAVNDDDEDPQTTKTSREVDLDLDSEEYKKKVIMEGLLGRNHRAIV